MSPSSFLHRPALLVGLGLLTLLLACAARPVDYTVLERGSSGVRSDDLNFAVVTSAGEFEGLWSRIHAFRTPRPDAPAVDFPEKMVLYAGTGQKPTTGYGISVEAVSLHAGTLSVRLNLQKPPENSITGQMITHPYVLFSVERPPEVKKVKFHDRQGKLLSLIEVSP